MGWGSALMGSGYRVRVDSEFEELHLGTELRARDGLIHMGLSPPQNPPRASSEFTLSQNLATLVSPLPRPCSTGGVFDVSFL